MSGSKQAWLYAYIDTEGESPVRTRAACGRNYDKAMHCVSALRGASIRLRRGAGFNQLLGEVAERFGPGSLQWGFWQRVDAERISLVTDEEQPGVGVDAAAAAAFLQQHSGIGQQVRSFPGPCSLVPHLQCIEAGMQMYLPRSQQMHLPAAGQGGAACHGGIQARGG